MLLALHIDFSHDTLTLYQQNDMTYLADGQLTIHTASSLMVQPAWAWLKDTYFFVIPGTAMHHYMTHDMFVIHCMLTALQGLCIYGIHATYFKTYTYTATNTEFYI